jgi:hypothetical protein
VCRERGEPLLDISNRLGLVESTLARWPRAERKELAALFYTLFETAKLSGVDPRAYVTLAAKRAVADHGVVTVPSDLT